MIQMFTIEEEETMTYRQNCYRNIDRQKLYPEIQSDRRAL